MSISSVAIGGAFGASAGALIGMAIKEKEMLENFFKITMANRIATTAGQEYACIGSNLNTAIQNLDHGTVFVGGDITIDSPINLKQNVKVDFLGHYVTLNTDTVFIYCQSCMDSGVRNCQVSLYPTQTRPVFHLKTVLTGNWATSAIKRNTFENITVKNTGGKYTWTDQHTGKKHPFFAAHDYDAILLDVAEETYMLDNMFNNLYFEGVNTGIHLLKSQDTVGWSHHNLFENIFFWDYVKACWIDVPSAYNPAYAANTFLRVGAESAEYSTHGFLLTWGSGNFFIHCQVYDWVNWKLYQGWPDPVTCPYPYDWYLGPQHDSLKWNYIYSRAYLLHDEGYNTQYCGPPLTWCPPNGVCP